MSTSDVHSQNATEIAVPGPEENAVGDGARERRNGLEGVMERDRRPWAVTRLALGFVGLVLVMILAFPLVIRERLDAFRDEIANLAEPARESSELIARSLAVEVGADRAYQLTGEPTFRTQFIAAWNQQEHALGVLSRLAPLLGDSVRSRTAALREALHAWAVLPFGSLRGDVSRSQRRAFVATQQRLFARTAAAAAALDDAIHGAADRKRAAAVRISDVAAVVTASLSALALVALLLLSWLARELRRLAREEAQLRGKLQGLFAARDRLIRGFSHDVKNPLGAADGYADLLQSGMIREPSRQAEALGRIRASIRAALRLIEDLLELARAEAGQLELRFATVDLSLVARSLADEYGAKAEAAGLALTVEAGPGLPSIRSDAHRIGQILGNLVSNAIKYARSGGAVGIRVRAGPRWAGERATEWVSVAVWDRGPGIPSDSLERVFEEFTRLEADGKEGAGLGLAISRRLARALGGDLTVESEPGAGSCFTLWLPTQAAVAA